MRTVYVATILAAAVVTVASTAGAETVRGYVKGHTTIAEVEQVLGAPMDTVIAPNGALTLVYPYDRLSERISAKPAAVTTVQLQFDTVFTYQNAVFKQDVSAPVGLAAR